MAKVFNVHSRSVFYSILLPSSAPQDLIRAALLSDSSNYNIVWGSTWVNKLIGTIAQAVLLTAGLIIMPKTVLPGWIFKVVYFMFGLILVVFAVSFSKTLTRPLRPVLRSITPAKILSVVENLRQAIYSYRGKPLLLFNVSLLSVVLQLFGVINASLILKGITGNFYFSECLFFIPLIELILISLPLTPNGAGIREALVVFFLQSRIGLGEMQSTVFVTIAALGYIVRVLGGIPAAIEVLSTRKKCC
jgi:hypothetical protein